MKKLKNVLERLLLADLIYLSFGCERDFNIQNSNDLSQFLQLSEAFLQGRPYIREHLRIRKMMGILLTSFA